MNDASTGTALRIEAPAAVRGITLVDGGQRLCARLAGPRIVRWSCADGRLLSDVTYRGPVPTAGAIAPTGNRLAIATEEGAVRVLDAATLAVVAEMRPASSPRADLVFSADGALLAGAARGRRLEPMVRALLAGAARGHRLELTVWNVATGAPVASFADPTRELAGIAFHPSERLAALSVLTGDVVLLDLASGRPTRTLSDALMAAEALAFSPDGSTLVAASYDGALLAWDTARWGVRRLQGISGANALAISPDGAWATVSRSSYNPPETLAEARLIDLRTGRVRAAQQLGIASTTAVGFLGPERARVASARGASLAVYEIG